MKIEKIDPYNYKERYFAWKKASEKGIKGLSAQNEALLKQYLRDMENGLNVALGHKTDRRRNRHFLEPGHDAFYRPEFA